MGSWSFCSPVSASHSRHIWSWRCAPSWLPRVSSLLSVYPDLKSASQVHARSDQFVQTMSTGIPTLVRRDGALRRAWSGTGARGMLLGFNRQGFALIGHLKTASNVSPWRKSQATAQCGGPRKVAEKTCSSPLGRPTPDALDNPSVGVKP